MVTLHTALNSNSTLHALGAWMIQEIDITEI